jgi:integrase
VPNRYALVPQQTGVLFIIMQQVQPSLSMVLMQSQQAWIISPHFRSPLVQVIVQPLAVMSQLYAACDKARMHEGPPFPPADWWRALLVMGYMTGWRTSDMLGLRRDDLDLDAGTAITRAADNKGKRDERVKPHPAVVEKLRKLAGFDVRVFPWNHNRRTLRREFLRVQQAAGIEVPCLGEHEHTPHCHAYSFHDLRRAFATMNADRLTPDALQGLMRHKS